MAGETPAEVISFIAQKKCRRDCGYGQSGICKGLSGQIEKLIYEKLAVVYAVLYI